MSGAIPLAVLMCHAPIVVPPIGGSRGAACRRTTEAMRRVAREVAATAPDTVVVVSPHTPRSPGWWTLAGDDPLAGDFSAFGVPGAGVSLPADREAAEAILAAARTEGLSCRITPVGPLDHGAAVPLWFLAEAGWRGPTVVVGLPWHPGDEAPRFGAAVRRAAQASGGRWVVVASGDMSHRLQPGAPSGFHPRAGEFDEEFVRRLRAGDLASACAVDAALREIAAEDVVDSTAVAAAAVDWDGSGGEVIAYEGPFGVGYTEAILHREAA